MCKINKLFVFTFITLFSAGLANGMRLKEKRISKTNFQHVLIRPITKDVFYTILKFQCPSKNIKIKGDVTDIAVETTKNEIILRHLESNEIIQGKQEKTEKTFKLTRIR